MDNVTRLLMQGAAGAAGGATYVDDVFSSYLWRGNETARTIPTGIDNTKGALAWVKSRNDSHQHHLVDTERGSNKIIYSDSFMAEATIANRITGFTNNGFNIGSAGQVNGTNVYEYAGWNFRKAKGFFDIVTYSGNATGSSSPARQIAHNLGCIPGMIMVKCTTQNQGWAVYHRGNGNWKWISLNDTAASAASSAYWNNTSPTSTHFTVKHDGQVNENGHDYVAYLFAGGASTAATAPSVDFNGSSYLDIADHSDFTFGTDDFTIECWYKADNLNLSNNWDYIFSSGWPVQLAHTVDSANTNSRFSFYFADSNSGPSYLVSNLNTGNGSVYANQWYHVAVTRSGSTFRIFLNGELKDTATSSGSAPAPNTNSAIGRFSPSSPYYYANGRISNFRYVKGTAVYTESFRPPTEPLTDITNTKLLCCNSSSVTGSTVTPGTITNNGATASTDPAASPFDDPDGYKFGENEDQNIIKIGRYTGRGNGPLDVELGWEPQWLMVKNGSTTSQWIMFDNMRGTATGQPTEIMWANSDSSEGNFNVNQIDFTPTGFKVNITGNSEVNQTDQTHIYLAIRRPDGYVGKPPEAATDVFHMLASPAAGSPWYRPTDFAVDMSLSRQVTGSHNWDMGARLIQGRRLQINNLNAETSGTYNQYDYNNGWNSYSSSLSGHQSWMWKRHAGFDVVAYKGDDRSGGRPISHNLSVTPEMMWIKVRNNSTQPWMVYHKDVGHGKELSLNTNNAESNNIYYLNNTAPTSTHFTVGQADYVNGLYNYIAMLFASANDADGNPISKVGSYTGNGSTTGTVITTGFAPRFIIIKAASTTGGWFLYDTVRGLASGNDQRIQLEDPSAQYGHADDVDPNSTGFQLKNAWDNLNGNGSTYIYYAHA